MQLSPEVADQKTADGLHVGVGQASRQGGRAENQDFAACYVGTPRNQLTIGLLAALSDGMGGTKGGRVAAELAVRGFIDGCLGMPATIGIARIGARAADAVNRWVHTLGRSDPDLNGMACTLSALVLCGRSTHLVHVGDSRVYRMRDDALTLLTTDHTLGAPGTTQRPDSGGRCPGQSASSITSRKTRTCTIATSSAAMVCMACSHTRKSTPLLARRAAPGETAQRLVEQATVGADSDNATAVVLDILALPSTQFADLELAIAEQPLRNAPVSGDGRR